MEKKNPVFKVCDLNVSFFLFYGDRKSKINSFWIFCWNQNWIQSFLSRFFFQPVSLVIFTNSLWVVFFLPHFRLVSWNSLSRLFYGQWSEKGFPGGWFTTQVGVLLWICLQRNGTISLVNTRAHLSSLLEIDDRVPFSSKCFLPPPPRLFSPFLFPNRDGDLLGIQNILWKGSASTSQEARDSPEICIVHHISDCMVSEGWKGEGRTCLGKIWETKQVLESDRVNSGDMREKFLPRA